jgi:hypothetical protein
VLDQLRLVAVGVAAVHDLDDDLFARDGPAPATAARDRSGQEKRRDASWPAGSDIRPPASFFGALDDRVLEQPVGFVGDAGTCNRSCR